MEGIARERRYKYIVRSLFIEAGKKANYASNSRSLDKRFCADCSIKRHFLLNDGVTHIDDFLRFERMRFDLFVGRAMKEKKNARIDQFCHSRSSKNLD